MIEHERKPIGGRGFTLIEVLVTLVIASIVAATAVSAGAVINRILTDTRRHAVTWSEVKRIEEALLSRVQQAGGDPMAAYQSVIVEDNCGADPARLLPGCDGADRLTILAVRSDLPSCTVTASGVVLKGTATAPAPCCITTDFVGPAVLIKNDGSVVTLSLHNPNTSACQVNAPAGQGNPGPVVLGDGILALITSETLFPRRVSADGEYELLLWRDKGAPGNNKVDADEVQVFADRLWDFQVALGFDGSPEDGDVVDTNSTTDEWLGNAEPIPALLSSVVAPSQLRMIDIAIIVGVRSERAAVVPIKLLNRATAVAPPGVYLAATRGQVGFRNLNISVP